MLKKDRVICLRTTDYSETSQVVTFFGRETGKLGAIAKGARRPKSAFEGPIEVFSFGEVVFAPAASGKLATLAEFARKPLFRQLRSRLFALNCALFAAELVVAFTREYDRHPELFDSLIQLLTDVDTVDDDFDALGLLILFQLTLLKETGSMPVLERCANCDSRFSEEWLKAYFSSSLNGLICPDCEQAFVDKVRLSKACAACFADLKLITTVENGILSEIEKVLVYHFTEQMGRRPKMAKYFMKT